MPRLPTVLVALSLAAVMSAGAWGAILVAMQGPFE
ncbi:type II secretory pathway component PulJ [Methylobacterium sp. BE186]|nr:type II secretory pathway component PulJ [Methylobacterium sp. BE186]